MNVILCLDNKMGTMFNNRRQSQDRILCEKVVSLINGGRLYLRPYSYMLFEGYNAEIIQSENFLKQAESGDFCFVEGDELAPFENMIESIILFRWNRAYPSDRKLDIDLSKGWLLTHNEEFPGSSHENITMEIYVRG